MLTDSHSHLDDARFAADRDALIQRAWDSGVHRILTIGNGTGPDDMGCGMPFADAYPWIFTSIGVHPHDASKAEDSRTRCSSAQRASVSRRSSIASNEK